LCNYQAAEESRRFLFLSVFIGDLFGYEILADSFDCAEKPFNRIKKRRFREENGVCFNLKRSDFR